MPRFYRYYRGENAPFDFNYIEKKWFWPILGMGILILFYFLRSVCTPFFIAIFIGYLGYPIINWFQHHGISRTISSLSFIVLICIVLVMFMMIFLPVLQVETIALMREIPGYLQTLNEKYMPWLERLSGQSIQIDTKTIQQFLADNISNVSNMGVYALRYLSQRSSALIGLIFNSFLIPIVLFYVLRDWHPFIRFLKKLIPFQFRRSVFKVVGEMSDILSQTIRGQITVVIIQSFLYSFALWLAGLEFSIAIGVMTGVLSIIPYVGFSIGFLTGILTALLQFDSFWQLIPVLIAFGVVQAIESFYLTPTIVGNRIGIHPVIVIFSLLAFGELFGFTGVLLALPASSVLVVACRHLLHAYTHSRFYTGKRNGTIITES